MAKKAKVEKSNGKKREWLVANPRYEPHDRETEDGYFPVHRCKPGDVVETEFGTRLEIMSINMGSVSVKTPKKATVPGKSSIGPDGRKTFERVEVETTTVTHISRTTLVKPAKGKSKLPPPRPIKRPEPEKAGRLQSKSAGQIMEEGLRETERLLKANGGKEHKAVATAVQAVVSGFMKDHKWVGNVAFKMRKEGRL